MNFRIRSVTWIITFVLLLFAGSTVSFSQISNSTAIVGLNRIEGRVMDENNNGVDNVYVELTDNYGSLLSRQRTTGLGRYTFRGMVQGRYLISVKPYGTNLMEDSKEIEINNQYSRSDTVYQDFHLIKDKRAIEKENTGIASVVYAQEVPPEALRLYKRGVDEISSKPEVGRADLAEAVKVFPNYFDALVALGKSYVIVGKYADGYPFLLRAIDVNSRCPDCYYSLSLAFYQMNETAAAVKAINAAVLLQPRNGPVRLLQGMIYRQNKDLPNAEKALLLANTLFATSNSEVHWQLAGVYNRLNRNKEAADELDKYLKSKTDMTEAEKEKVRKLMNDLRKSK